MTHAVTSRRSSALGLLLAAGVLTTSSACEAGHFFNAPSLSCNGSCPCSPWVGLNESRISSNSGGSPEYGNNALCTWIISGGKARVTFDSVDTERNYDLVYVDECLDAGFTLGCRALAALSGQQEPGLSYESSTSHLRIRFASDGGATAAGFTATVSGGILGCTPCSAGTYTAASNSSECTACPTNAVSADGSTALSSCECPAGYTGNAGLGGQCVACEAGTYKNVSGSAICAACPSNAVSERGSTGLGSCVCRVGYTGDAGVGSHCVACPAGTFKPFDGADACASCPDGAEPAEGGEGCVCCGRHGFEHNVPSVRCGDSNSPGKP